MSARHDAGLAAVARVRGVRETDSRIGLQTALGEQRSAQARVDELRARVDAADAFESGPAATFLALRQSLEVLGGILGTAEAERNQAATISEAALARWHQDKSRLGAIEMLLERRAAARREEAGRREARDLDDLAAQRWLRREAGR
ncbi:hypothetical protein EFK50_12930 [Nocardioides marmoriginsengisoli]|uniref:Flagellar FliJ protein n=1 Tax=Nocardioides marmoriginsengisoli TaxID=661483 RepID=A0A3N0CGU8_9ACTN|nr:flagellar FliJ family protein [Nocardioides marmoriginsengisoli]RNL62655.1 hypothetical protein EFK50_12930 [Nocardioides marmoriginsengisoli]